MRIEAWSDGHGLLPEIDEKTDVVIIAGDLTPLNIQRNYCKCLEWFRHEFLDYCDKLKAEKIILTPGNHDFFFETIKKNNLDKEIASRNLTDKVIVLYDESYEYGGMKFYGCPWCEGPFGWAFSPNYGFEETYKKYKFIPEDCDILICHQPPMIGKVGCSYPNNSYEREFGSEHLNAVLENRNIKCVFCGHIHSGIHGGVNFNNTRIYNVSLLDEDYNEAYPTTMVEI